jgi:hypothetical protein
VVFLFQFRVATPANTPVEAIGWNKRTPSAHELEQKNSLVQGSRLP